MKAPERPAPDFLNGLWLPLVTPLHAGYIDLDALRRLAVHYSRFDIAGYVLFGSTGEGNLISEQEKILGFETVRACVPGMPLMMGAGGVSTQDVYAFMRRMEPLRPDGWLVPPPYYLRPSPEGIAWHYRQIADATDRPVVAYDVPERTGARMSVELIESLCLGGGCAAIKECDQGLLAAIDARGKVLSMCGDDALFLSHFLWRGAGAISASAHVRPDLFMAVMNLARAGRMSPARELFAALGPVIGLLFEAPNPSAIKKYLAMQGLIDDELRLPLTSASGELGWRIANAVDALPSEQDVQQLLLKAA
jgi:4-hydroxy-tetrahydrodipicolinate synthase